MRCCQQSIVMISENSKYTYDINKHQIDESWWRNVPCDFKLWNETFFKRALKMTTFNDPWGHCQWKVSI